VTVPLLSLLIAAKHY